MKNIFFFLTLLTVIVAYGQSLNPLKPGIFDFHDTTQPARIQQFVLNLQNLKIPPRLAPDFSFKLGYPVFNFYAPASYWISGLIGLLGFDIINTLKLSFLIGMIVAFSGTYLLMKTYYSKDAALLSSVLYISSLYFPVSIFVRGNLGELWFMALFPLSLFLIRINTEKKSKLFFLFTVVVLSLNYTVHNLLSMIFIPISILFLMLQKHRLKNIAAVMLAIIIAGYFFIPLFLENGLTYAKQVAGLTKYSDHFLCWNQLWQSPWGNGGSVPGCINDGMSFKIGKIQIILALLGLGTLVYRKLKKRKNLLRLTDVFFIFLSLVSLFLTTYSSRYVWDMFSPVYSLFQFPWRFLSITLVGIAFMAGIFLDKLKLPHRKYVYIFFAVLLIIYTSKYFIKPGVRENDFGMEYISNSYIEQKAAYSIAEYLPKTADYSYWRKIEKNGPVFEYRVPGDSTTDEKIISNKPFEKAIELKQPAITAINIHYFPFWKITVNDKELKPTQFDSLGRPIIKTDTPSVIRVRYEETNLEKSGNIISIVGIGLLIVTVMNVAIWKKINS